MFQINSLKMKATALLTGGVLMVGALASSPAPAQAADKGKIYKSGGIAAGILGAYLILKGKTVPGAIAAGAGYYAYKKGKKENNQSNNNVYGSTGGTVYPDTRYSYGDRTSRTSNTSNNSDNRYPDYVSPDEDSNYDDTYSNSNGNNSDYGYYGVTPSSNGNGSNRNGSIVLK